MAVDNSGDEHPIKTHNVDSLTRANYNIASTVTFFSAVTATSVARVGLTNDFMQVRSNNTAIGIDLNLALYRQTHNVAIRQTDTSVHYIRHTYKQGKILDISSIREKSTKIERLLPPMSGYDLSPTNYLNISDKFSVNELAEPDRRMIRHEEIYASQRSAFRYNKPMAFVFDHSQLADHNNKGYAMGGKIPWSEYPTLKSLHDPCVFATKAGPITGGLYDVTTAAWKVNGKARWVKFPDQNDFDQQFPDDSNAKGQLLFESAEYQSCKNTIGLLNLGVLTPFMNLGIPTTTGVTDKIATELFETPEELTHNEKHGGHLLVQLGRGQRQQHILASESGRNWIYGGTHTYFTHPRRMIHMSEHSELSNTYKLLVHSNATYHFRCQPPIDVNADHKDLATKGLDDFTTELASLQPAPAKGTEALGAVNMAAFTCPFALATVAAIKNAYTASTADTPAEALAFVRNDANRKNAIAIGSAIEITTTDANVPVNYRYEGDFNIEQVTTKGTAPNMELDKYNLGVHGIREGRELLARAGKIVLEHIAEETTYSNSLVGAASSGARAVTTTPKIQIDEYLTEIKVSENKFITLFKDGSIILSNEGSKIEINSSGIGFYCGSELKATLSPTEFKILPGVQLVNENTTTAGTTSTKALSVSNSDFMVGNLKFGSKITNRGFVASVVPAEKANDGALNKDNSGVGYKDEEVVSGENTNRIQLLRGFGRDNTKH